jgi:hypothetical protein
MIPPAINYDSELMKLEIKMKETELAIKQAELQSIGEREARASRASPWGNVSTNYRSDNWNNWFVGRWRLPTSFRRDRNLQLERQKFESSLMLKAIETGNPEGAARNLLFLIQSRVDSRSFWKDCRTGSEATGRSCIAC